MHVYILENVLTFALFVRKLSVIGVVSVNICEYIVGNAHTLVIFVRNPFTVVVI